MVQVEGSHLAPLCCQSTDAPGPVQLWASHLHPEPASSPAGRYLQIMQPVDYTHQTEEVQQTNIQIS